MPYVRQRGSQLAIVHGTRDPETSKVEQHVLFTIYSKAEALEILGRGQPASPGQFRDALEHQHPGTNFEWPKLCAAIEQNLGVLPESYDYVGTRLRESFRPDLTGFARRLILTDPQWLASSWQLIDEHRQELAFVRDLIDWRLKMPQPTPAAAEWMADNPFHWRHAMSSHEVPPEAEAFATQYYENGDLDKAAAVFTLLTEAFDGYAEGYNYLGLVAFDRGDFALAMQHFRRCIELGRKLFPKRIDKHQWWRDLATRPFIRGLSNLALAHNHAGEHREALEVCDRLEHECHDVDRAATHRAAAHLCLGNWQKALNEALRLHCDSPNESLIAALAAYELGRQRDARVWFIHATLNVPRTVAMILDKSMPTPKNFEEAQDHNGGVAMRGSLASFLGRRSRASVQFFGRLWPEFAELRAELAAANAAWSSDRTGADRTPFDRIREMRSLEFAERHGAARGREGGDGSDRAAVNGLDATSARTAVSSRGGRRGKR